MTTADRNESARIAEGVVCRATLAAVAFAVLAFVVARWVDADYRERTDYSFPVQVWRTLTH